MVKNYSQIALKLETKIKRLKMMYNNCSWKDESKWDVKIIDCRMKAERLKDEIKKEYDSCHEEHCDDCDDAECPTCKPEFDKLRFAMSVCDRIITGNDTIRGN